MSITHANAAHQMAARLRDRHEERVRHLRLQISAYASKLCHVPAVQY